jgi:DNA primase
MTTATDFKETVKQQADIVRIVGDYVALKKAGAQNYSGLCPFHKEKTPSFSVHATRQFYHCFGCGVSGDVFSFVQKVENISFPEALRVIAQKLGIPLPKVTFSSPAEAQEARHRGALLDMHERACGFFEELLRRPEGAPAREYLAGRGLNEEMVKRFRIGFAPDSGFLLRDALRRDFDEELLKASGLFSWKEPGRSQGSTVPQEGSEQNSEIAAEHGKNRSLESNIRPASGADVSTRDDKSPMNRDGSSRLPDAGSGEPKAKGQELRAIYSKFRNRVMFPITNDQGRIIAFTGRRLSTDDKAGPKYLNSPETAIYSKSRVLFNLDKAKDAIRKLEYAILVEGQMDCISVFAAGFHNVIASSGTAFTEAQAKLLGRFSKNVVVNFDPDTAGANATERTLGLLVEEEFQIKVLTLETGFDPDLFIRRKGKDAYAEALRHSQRYFDYLIERSRTLFPVRSAEGKVKAVNYLLPHMQRVPNRIVRDELAHEIAQKLAIDSAVLRQEMRHVATNRAVKAVQSSPEVQITDAERILIRALASATQMQANEEHLSARDGAEEEFDPARQAFFALRHERPHEGLAAEALIQALLDAGQSTGDPMGLPLTESDRRMLASILMKEDEELTADLLDGAVRALRRITLRRRQEHVQQEIVKAVREGNSQRVAELSEEKLRLKRALRDPALLEDPSARAS